MWGSCEMAMPARMATMPTAWSADDERGQGDAAGKLGGRHDGRESRRQVRRGDAEQHHGDEQGAQPQDQAELPDAVLQRAAGEVVGAQREAERARAQAHDEPALDGRQAASDAA